MKKNIFFLFIFLTFFANNIFAQDLIKELEELKKLYNQGVITQEEFTTAKKKVIGLDNNQKKEVTWTAYARKNDNQGLSGNSYNPIKTSYFKKKTIVRFGTNDQQNIFNEVISKTINKCKISLNFIKDKECYVFRIKYSDKYTEQDVFSGAIESALNVNKIKVKWEGMSEESIRIAKETKLKKIKVAKKEKPKNNQKKVKKITKKASSNALVPDLEGLLFILEEANERGEEIDYDVASKQYGFKNFKDFVKTYSKEYEVKNLTVKQVKEFIQVADTSVEIVESQENLDKLHSLIFNNKHFKKYQKKKNSYLKVFEKGQIDGNKLDHMALAAYINYEKEMAKITKDPNLKEISRFTWDWGYSWGTGSPKGYALSGCEKEVKRLKLFGGECILVDLAIKITNSHKNLLQPRLKKSNQKIAKKNVEQIPKDFIPVSVEDHITMLGTFSKPTSYPEGMLKELGAGAGSFNSKGINAARKMSLIFRRTDQYHQRHPGKMLHALAYFELFYQYQLKKKAKRVDNFLEHFPEKKRGGKTIVTLLKFNKARKKMREALGMDLNTSTEEAMESFWALGDYLEKGKVVKQKVHPDIKIRKKILSKYKSRVSDFKSKLENEKDNELYDKIYIPTVRKFKLSKLKRKKLYE